MVNVDIIKNKENYIYSFCVSGHAEYAEEGSDIICSAVSVIVINTINSIEKFTEDDIEYITDEGYIFVTLPQVKENNIVSREADVLIKAMVFALDSMENDYGNEFIKINYREV